ncbi:MAG: hypothetical protein HKN33_18205 [Pyrinomonadaceae bacterium]|nr:hypothetical protein [Pyrinomonadaceae bacterium]
MQFTLYDLIGSVGVGVIVVTYLLLQTDRLKSSDATYSILNAVGAALIIFSLINDFNFPAFVIEFFWLLISIYGIGKWVVSRETREKA